MLNPNRTIVTPVHLAANRIKHAGKWEIVIRLGLFVVVVFLAFYNLEYNPRPWHDEGSALLVARTLVEDGVYASRNSDGYQTFGAVQSVGPTVLLPVAASFKLFGVGLLQGRAVMAVFMLLTLVTFYRVGSALFGRNAALLATLLLLGSPAVRFFFLGRQALGEVPALGLFLGGWLAWSRGVRTGQRWRYAIAGLLLGGAMITKSQYTVLGFGALAILAVLDLFYYRQRVLGGIIIVGLVALVCVASWWGWQLAYFGMNILQENLMKLRQLGASTTGINAHVILQAFTLLAGGDYGQFYYLWGFGALVYACFWCLKRDLNSLVLAPLCVFTLLALGYYFWSAPWLNYIFAPAAITSLFVSKLWYDLADGFQISWSKIWVEIRSAKPGKVSIGLAVFITVSLMIGYQLQNLVRADVLDKDGHNVQAYWKPLQLKGPEEVAAYLETNVDKDMVVETWERELGILTDHRYHFPDQSLLAGAHATVYRNGVNTYALGIDYFHKYRPDYIVIGWFARWLNVYDTDFVTDYGELLTTIGDGEWRYDIYQLHLP